MSLDEFIAQLEAIREKDGGDLEVWSPIEGGDGCKLSAPVVEVKDLRYKDSPYLHLMSDWTPKDFPRAPGPKVVIV